LSGLGFKVVGTLRVRFRPDEKALKDVRALAKTLAEAIK
jgi:flavorubredoxin